MHMLVAEHFQHSSIPPSMHLRQKKNSSLFLQYEIFNLLSQQGLIGLIGLSTSKQRIENILQSSNCQCCKIIKFSRWHYFLDLQAQERHPCSKHLLGDMKMKVCFECDH